MICLLIVSGPFSRPITCFCDQETLKKKIVLFNGLDLSPYEFSNFFNQSDDFQVIWVFWNVLSRELLQCYNPGVENLFGFPLLIQLEILDRLVTERRF